MSLGKHLLLQCVCRDHRIVLKICQRRTNLRTKEQWQLKTLRIQLANNGPGFFSALPGTFILAKI